MSLASNSHAASGPSQPEYAAALTPFKPMCSETAFAGAAVVLGPQRRGLRIPQALDERGAVDHVGEKQRTLVHLVLGSPPDPSQQPAEGVAIGAIRRLGAAASNRPSSG
jgi:hypothetical protein